MTEFVRRLGPALATMLLLALLVGALPGAVTAADAPSACRVKNLASGASYGNLQRAVWAAQPGHRLRVRGTCIGTTIIRKDLRIEGGRQDRPARARSGSSRPAIVIDPSVSDLTIASSLVVRGGLVSVDPSVDRLMLAAFRIDDGFRVGPAAR